MTGAGVVFAAAGEEWGAAVASEGGRDGGAIPILLGPEHYDDMRLYIRSEWAAAEVRAVHRFMLAVRSALRELAEEVWEEESYGD